MKRFLCVIFALSLAWASSSAAPGITKGSTVSAPRADTSSNYVDWWLVNGGPTSLISAFGYNSGTQQWLQLFDSNVGPTVAVTSWDNAQDSFAATNHGLSTGQRLQVPSTVAGITAGIYYVRLVGGDPANVFNLYDTLAHALAGGTGKQDVTGATSTTTFNLLPVHTFAIAATDNFSFLIPASGASFGKGLVVANSTTGPTYTAGSKNITLTVTYAPMQ